MSVHPEVPQQPNSEGDHVKSGELDEATSLSLERLYSPTLAEVCLQLC